ncbi:MAG: peptidoglycan DD-metalloendopeptidase family protein [Veillonella sp. oral taxon 780]|nr:MULTISPECIES: M23 family metallopeptidase [unclassified Veillonella]MBS6627059.1 peptidoglycan DD-metalloendopeptidase family protein [Veillonella sp. oral taxon 780]
MKKKTVTLVASLLCGSIMMATPYWYQAQDEDLTNQLSNIQQQLTNEANKKSEAEKTIGTVYEQLHAIQIELDTATADLKQVQADRIRLDQDITKTEAELKAAQERLQSREKVFYKRVRDIYINGRLSYLDVVVGSKDFSDFANRMEMLKRILQADMELINTIKTEREEIASKKAKLEADRAKVLELEKVAQEKQTIINQKKAERQAVLERAMNDRDTAERAYNELMASSASITAMLQQRAAERAAAAAAASQGGSGGGATTTWVQGTGQLAAPVNAPITSDFGWRIHPIYGTSRLHAGTDFGVDEGTPVHAADGGVVVEAGWISGYGYTVIIDHGNGMSTLYAHNSDVAVSPGQTVSKGQVVSYSGNTGGSTGPHLHFEVRINGEPTDPMGYL